MAPTRPSDIKRKKGTLNLAMTKKWDGNKWVPVNVPRDGQRATLSGKPVIRKNGKWVPYTPVKRGYKPVSKPKPKPKKVTVSDHIGMTRGKRYPESGRNWTNPHGQKSNQPSSGDRSTWPTRKPTPPRNTTTTSSSSKPTKPTAKPAEKKPAEKAPTSKRRTWLSDNYKPGKPRRSTAGKSKNKPKQSARMREALRSLKVRDYKKKKKR